ncbi:MAG: YkgJ family cysteine cluster protein [Planctomycetes bacterium]|nr:YkgJ family cysteine cluster protein [Planctomycetota bacterium]
MDKPWYDAGLKFSCTQCGRCCGGAPGDVWVSEQEIDALADRLGVDRESFSRKYTRKVYRRGISLVEKANYDCIFFDRTKGCTVYEDRPVQCRTWPFWRANLRSEEDWQVEAESCPGMNKGTLYDAEHVSAIAADDGLAE